MSRRSRSSGVKGPNSALTEFLRNEGITDAFRQRREREDELQTPEIEATAEVPAVLRRATRLVALPATSNEEEDVEHEIRVAARRKRRAAGGFPSDDDDDDDDDDFKDDDDDDDELKEMKKFGDADICVDCGDEFHLSVYSRFDSNRKGYLCESCHETLKKRERQVRRQELNARKKRKKLAQALLDKTEVKIPSLQDVCIKVLTRNIGDVEVLGDIGQVNMNKISRILSKNRSLNDATVPLFLNPGLKSLELWDCSNVDSDSLAKIASFCPNLESLTLFMCGQLHNDTLSYYKTNLPHLTELSLNGPFLISDVMWQDFFEEGAPNLTKFEVRNTHRFGNDSLISLLENCGANLTLLKLSRLDGIDAQAVYDLLPHYLGTSKLTHLELSYPYKEELVTDDLLINILSITGESLRWLNVDGCAELSDKFLLEGIGMFCPNLTTLSMRNLDLLTNDGFAKTFANYSHVNTGGLINVDLTKCTGLGDEAIHQLFIHSANTMVELSLNSLDALSKDFLLQILTDDLHPSKVGIKQAIDNASSDDDDEPPKYFPRIHFPYLTKWDLGFVRAVDDEVLFYISSSCPKLKILEVYGDNKCTNNAKIRNQLIVIGRQHDTI